MSRQREAQLLRARAHRAIVIALVAFSFVACKAVLGLDPPELDPCIDGGCFDGAIDGARDAADAGADVAPDHGPIVGVRCGGGSFAVSGCNGSTPVCCESTDAGVTTFACVASTAACAGFPIACASYNDCAGNDVCCHSATQIKCVTTASCANADLVCEPDGAPDQCPASWKCAVPLTNAGVASPYFGCMP